MACAHPTFEKLWLEDLEQSPQDVIEAEVSQGLHTLQGWEMAFWDSCQILWEAGIAILQCGLGCLVTQGTQKKQRESQRLPSRPRKAMLCALSK